MVDRTETNEHLPPANVRITKPTSKIVIKTFQAEQHFQFSNMAPKIWKPSTDQHFRTREVVTSMSLRANNFATKSPCERSRGTNHEIWTQLNSNRTTNGELSDKRLRYDSTDCNKTIEKIVAPIRIQMEPATGENTSLQTTWPMP